jgi:hypothetical protein
LKTNGESVLAGTVVAKGGRTGNIGAVSFNPSHVHLTVGNAGGRYYPQLRKSLDEYFPENAMVLPSNYSPLLFPCRGETPRVDWDAKNCKLDNARFTQFCWAGAELKCPHIKKSMSKSDESVFQLQAQLRYLNEKPSGLETKVVNAKYKIKSEESELHPDHLVDLSAFLTVDNNEDYFHPYHRNIESANQIGIVGDAMTKVDDSSLAAGTALTILSSSVHRNANHRLKKVRYTDSEGTNHETWIEQALIDGTNKVTELIQNVPATKPSKTQMAIYCFRKQHDLLKMDNYYQNFETDDEFWEELNNQCGF